MTRGVGLELQPTIVKPGVPTSLLPALLIHHVQKNLKLFHTYGHMLYWGLIFKIYVLEMLAVTSYSACQIISISEIVFKTRLWLDQLRTGKLINKI